MRKLKVLIGSAGSVFCDITKAALELWGCAVTVIPDGKQMCATLLSSQVDICFLDWDLPKMSGPETCKWIRAVEAKKQPYIVLVTERNRVEQVRAAYIAGANDLSCQPVQFGRTSFPGTGICSEDFSAGYCFERVHRD
jgi:sigma-B regulation protein RsbU (phosphoserine phosphatase)